MSGNSEIAFLKAPPVAKTVNKVKEKVETASSAQFGNPFFRLLEADFDAFAAARCRHRWTTVNVLTPTGFYSIQKTKMRSAFEYLKCQNIVF